jgi:phosphoglycolate phosphatase-like HAD superfamily hydrolase
MPEPAPVLPSWHPGRTRDAIVAFLDAVAVVPVERRVACLDNDGTLWCEKPTYVQLDFFVDVLKRAVARDPTVAEEAEFAALLSGDRAAMADLGLPRIAMALAGLCAGITPEAFTDLVHDFMAGAQHPTLARPTRSTVYQPMLELLAALRDLDFTICVVTGGGTEFVRAVSDDLYGVPPERVVGTLLEYDVIDHDGKPSLVRSARLFGEANEGAAKVSGIQTQLGRRPILGVGNSAGDRQMLAWAASGEGPTLALLLDHDDAEREFSYRSEAETFVDAEPITDVAVRRGWTVISMATDWASVFAPMD